MPSVDYHRKTAPILKDTSDTKFKSTRSHWDSKAADFCLVWVTEVVDGKKEL